MPTEFLELPDGKLAYDDSGGDGQPVIMLPGMGALRSEYRYLAPALTATGYRAVTVDLRGHGESSVGWPDHGIATTGQDILALIEHLGAGPAHVVGTSYSPGAAVWAAAEKPEAIRSMVLIGAFVRDPKAGAIQKAALALMMSGPWKVAAWVSFYKTLYPGRKPDDFETYLKALKANLSEPGRFAALKAMISASKVDSESRLSRVSAPSLVVMGSADPDWPDPLAEAGFIRDALSAELVIIEAAGHYPQSEDPESTVPAILGFLESNRG